ncbi:MAG: hypothetical protein V3U32_02455 [Anaerolineales bacterium]
MTAAIVLVFLLSGLLWLAPLISDPMGVLFWRGGAFSDLLISHWPNAAFVRHSLIEWGQLPLWNPMILSGAPFAADPLSGLYYPPNWLAFAIAPGFAFNLLAWLHLAWGGLGTWKLSRALGVSSGPAIVAGLAFAGMPKLIGHIGLGHVSLVFAVCWTPWVLLAFDRAVRKMDLLPSAALAGAALGMVFLIDPRWYLPMALLSGAYVVWRIAHSHKVSGGDSLGNGPNWEESEGAYHGNRPNLGRGASPQATEDSQDDGPNLGREPLSQAKEDPPGDGPHWGRAASSLIIAGLMSLAIAAILAAPFGEFVSLSTRADLALGESAELSLPASYLLNVLAPEYAGWPEWQIYAGVVLLFLALAALAGRAQGRWFWAGIIIFSFVLALGNLTPLYGLMSALVPGFGQLRVPPRSLFLSSFALAMLAGMGLDQILKRRIPIKKLRVIGAALVGIMLPLALWFWLQNQTALQSAAYVVSAALIGLSVLWAGISVGKPSQRLIFGWCLLIALDLSLINLSTLEVRPVPDTGNVFAQVEVGNARVFSPSYSLPQLAAASAGIELADGINPLQLASYWEYMSRATGFDGDEYSVTLPPFSEGGPQAEWGFEPDATLMGNLSISQVVSAYPIADTKLEFEAMEDGLYIYNNPQARPRAWIEGGELVQIREQTANRLAMIATGPGLLITSEIMYPGWEVEIDGTPGSLETYQGLLRAVHLPPGEHEVEFTFRSGSLRVGALISILGLIVLASLWIRR